MIRPIQSSLDSLGNNPLYKKVTNAIEEINESFEESKMVELSYSELLFIKKYLALEVISLELSYNNLKEGLAFRKAKRAKEATE